MPENMVDLNDAETVVEVWDEYEESGMMDICEDEDAVAYDGPPAPDIQEPEELPERFPGQASGPSFVSRLFWFTVGTLRSIAAIVLVTTLAFFVYTAYQSDWDFAYAWSAIREFYDTVWWLTKRLFAWTFGL